MGGKRQSFWSSDVQAKYTDTVERKEREAEAERNGELAAENIESLWARLSQEEKNLFEYLVLSKRPTLVALFDDGLFTGLMSKGLLKIPQGVSTVFIQSHQTTYTIPKAVWASLQKKSELFPSCKEEDKTRIKTLSRAFEDKIEALLTDTSSKANT